MQALLEVCTVDGLAVCPRCKELIQNFVDSMTIAIDTLGMADPTLRISNFSFRYRQVAEHHGHCFDCLRLRRPSQYPLQYLGQYPQPYPQLSHGPAPQGPGVPLDRVRSSIHITQPTSQLNPQLNPQPTPQLTPQSAPQRPS
jgi:hypothetical protein